MKYTNEPSIKTAVSYGCKFVEEFADEENEFTKVFFYFSGRVLQNWNYFFFKYILEFATYTMWAWNFVGKF